MSRPKSLEQLVDEHVAASIPRIARRAIDSGDWLLVFMLARGAVKAKREELEQQACAAHERRVFPIELERERRRHEVV